MYFKNEPWSYEGLKPVSVLNSTPSCLSLIKYSSRRDRLKPVMLGCDVNKFKICSASYVCSIESPSTSHSGVENCSKVFSKDSLLHCRPVVT